MKVLVVGSWPGRQVTSPSSRTPITAGMPVRGEEGFRSYDDFIRACQAAGAALAQGGPEIIVGSDTEDRLQTPG